MSSAKEGGGPQPKVAFDLLCGLTPRLIYDLSRDGWTGAVDPVKLRSLGELTLDQIFLMVSKSEDFRGVGKVSQDTTQVSAMKDKDGFVKGLDSEGNPIKLKSSPDGRSLARRLMDEENERLKEEAKAKHRGETKRERRQRKRSQNKGN